MRIGAATSPVPLQCAKGVCVRNLTQEDIERVDAVLADMQAQDDTPEAQSEHDWDILRVKASSMLCDAEGKPLEGTDTVDELKAEVSKGALADMVAEEVLVVGKSRMARLLRIVSTRT